MMNKENGIDLLKSRLVGNSLAMDSVRNFILKVAPTNFPILIVGESGVGKSLSAHLIHVLSDRSNGPFVSINAAAIPGNIFSNELFGHLRGAFTGAISNKNGILKTVNGGTLLLENIEDLSYESQHLLLDFLINKSFVPLGGDKRVIIDVRIVATSYKKPDKLTSVLPDFLSYISGFFLNIPPLRERLQDIEVLAKYFLKTSKNTKNTARLISNEAVYALSKYSFPGNVRELKNKIEYSLIMSKGMVIRSEDLKINISNGAELGETIKEIKDENNRLKNEIKGISYNTISANPIWQGRRFTMANDYCFVLMPFTNNNNLQVVYKDYVKPIIEGRCGLKCERADDINSISGIMQSVWESINRARLLIADLTNRNSNVFYELGIAHTLGKPVIMITQAMKYIPFDLRHLRCIIYDFRPEKIEKFQGILEKTVRNVLSSFSDQSFNFH
jgi:hypothetical protein